MPFIQTSTSCCGASVCRIQLTEQKVAFVLIYGTRSCGRSLVYCGRSLLTVSSWYKTSAHLLLLLIPGTSGLNQVQLLSQGLHCLFVCFNNIVSAEVCRRCLTCFYISDFVTGYCSPESTVHLSGFFFWLILKPQITSLTLTLHIFEAD